MIKIQAQLAAKIQLQLLAPLSQTQNTLVRMSTAARPTASSFAHSSDLNVEATTLSDSTKLVKALNSL